MIASLEDNEIPQLEVSLGNISRLGMETDEVLSAAQTELNAIEREAASLAEREETATPVQAQEIAQEASGILSQIEALKGMMRGM